MSTPKFEEASLLVATKIFTTCILVIALFALSALWVTKSQRGDTFLPSSIELGTPTP